MSNSFKFTEYNTRIGDYDRLVRELKKAGYKKTHDSTSYFGTNTLRIFEHKNGDEIKFHGFPRSTLVMFPDEQTRDRFAKAIWGTNYKKMLSPPKTKYVERWFIQTNCGHGWIDQGNPYLIKKDAESQYRKLKNSMIPDCPHRIIKKKVENKYYRRK